jgi:cytochrome c oxidase subunit III
MTSAARTGQTLAVLASSMLFAALTSAMVVRRGIGPDWSRPDLPPYAWAACAVLVASSLLARTGRTLAAALCGAAFLALQTALINSLSLGETAPSFLWIMAAVHAVHAAGGIYGLLRFGRRAEIFWHFVGALWLYVMTLFGAWA